MLLAPVILLIGGHEMGEDALQLGQLLDKNVGADGPIEGLKGQVQVVQDIEGDLLSHYRVHISILLLLVVLGEDCLVSLVLQLDEEPSVVLVLLLHQAAVVQQHEHLPRVGLSLLLGDQTAAELVDSLGHADCVALLLDGRLLGVVGCYLRLLDVGFDRLLLLGLEGRVVDQRLGYREGFHYYLVNMRLLDLIIPKLVPSLRLLGVIFI